MTTGRQSVRALTTPFYLLSCQCHVAGFLLFEHQIDSINSPTSFLSCSLDIHIYTTHFQKWSKVRPKHSHPKPSLPLTTTTAIKKTPCKFLEFSGGTYLVSGTKQNSSMLIELRHHIHHHCHEPQFNTLNRQAQPDRIRSPSPLILVSQFGAIPPHYSNFNACIQPSLLLKFGNPQFSAPLRVHRRTRLEFLASTEAPTKVLLNLRHLALYMVAKYIQTRPDQLVISKETSSSVSRILMTRARAEASLHTLTYCHSSKWVRSRRKTGLGLIIRL
ncbi:hypothetical protein B0J11DRAFT_157818 [Dendryphion nanum]|uniref:Uncharacterized protein n=1 Tax=Dendryphion nanum TaxID=256645 RepID=A0A9P9E9X8_9PLEO|nr:hypothetical protein B0J11DRAFT_157818 [Dendryphion nanum]